MTSVHIPLERRSGAPLVKPTGPESAGERRGGRVGPFTTAQIVMVELVVGGVLVVNASGRGRPVLPAIAGAVGFIVLAFTFARSRGGWWYQQGLRRRRWRRRAQAVAKGHVRDPRFVAFAGMAPNLTVRQITDRGSRIGIGQDDDGWYALVEVSPSDGLGTQRPGVLAIERLARLVQDPAVPLSAISIVSHLMPAPSGRLAAALPAVASYREMLSGEPIVANHSLWVVVRLAPDDARAAAVSRGGGLEGVDRAIVAALGRVTKCLGADGLTARVLDREGMVLALLASCGVWPGPGGRSTGEERWAAWQGAGLAHVGLALSRWPARPVVDFLAELAAVPAALVAFAVTLAPCGTDVAARGLVRLAADEAAVAKSVSETMAVAARSGARLRRLDGDHGPAVYATSPGAGGRW